MKKNKIDIDAIKRQALDEFTEIVEKITLIARSGGSSTGFLQSLKIAAKEELWKFLFGERK